MSQLQNLASLAKLLKVPRAWLKEQADAGKIPHLRAGRTYLFNGMAVQQALAARAANFAKKETE